ncbi:MAG: tetratricopeptide repeat protein [Chloroflexi bacterium]|nr:tetratricopeptide repeat protein [Chloroflexota bacterium]MCL5026413.1 tetratricopeptide repeat protein [Chloroflexota bacterium]
MAEKVKARRARFLVALIVSVALLAFWPQPLAWAYLNLGAVEANRFLVGQENRVALRSAEENLSLASSLGIIRAYRQLARLRFRQGDYAGAEQLLNHWIVQHPEDPLGHWQMGRIYEAEGNRQAAIGEWRQAEAFNHLLRLGDEETDRGRWNEAISLYQAAVEVSAARASRGLGQHWDYVAERGWEAHQRLGRAIWRGVGDIEGALQQYKWASILAPWNLNLYLEVGSQYEWSGRWDDAMPWYQQALAADPANSETLTRMSQNRLLAGQPQEAQHWARAAIDAAPERATAWIILARALFEERAYAEAATELQRAVSKGVTTPDIYSYLGSALLSSKQFSQAEEAYTAGLALQPRDPYMQYGLGSTLVALGQASEAIGHFEAAVQVRPEMPDFWLGLADAYRQTGWAEDARAKYRKVLELAPDNDQAKRALQELGD